tara:strand:- start:26 stop:262 length:237 start_codon:yes stop_codon:yes gene_type:complete
MQVKEAIKQLQSKWYKPDDYIMIGWCEFGDIEIDNKKLTQEVWEEACAKADNSEYLFDMETARVLVDIADYDIKNGAL